MSVSHTPAPARSDVVTTTTDGADGADGAPAHPFRLHGRMLSAGAVAWAAAMAGFGLDPVHGLESAAYAAGSGLFQVGLLFLLRVLWRTRALGEGRLARGVLRFETLLVVLAICSTVSDGVGVTDFDHALFVVLDACWPFSMLGMFLIGIRIAVAGRWKGVDRFWPMVAESWAFVVIPVMGVFGQAVAGWVAPLHLLVGYTVLGLLVARRRG